MKKILLLSVIAMAFAFCINSNAWAEGWADSVIASSQGAITDIPDVPTQALGPSDFTNNSIPYLNTWHSLGDNNGFLTVGFSNPVEFIDGISLEVYEIGWQESFKLKLPDNSVWTPIVLSSEKGLRTSNPDSRLTVFGFDFGSARIGEQWSQFTIFDGQQGIPTFGNGSSSDIDAIRGITVTPEPLAMILFLVGGAPIGMSLLRRRKFRI